MEYTLHRPTEDASAHKHHGQAPIPPKPGKGERKPRPYLAADLNALWATAHSQEWKAMATLNPPPSNRIKTWIDLRDLLQALKIALTNWHRRKGFPPMICVTEFDEHDEGEVCANFHIGFAIPLSAEQQEMLCDWWLERHSLPDNRGRAFQHDAKGGGEKLQDYLAKDIRRSAGTSHPVKYPCHWLPKRTDSRLWFVIGAKRRPAREGAKLCSQRRLRRRRFDSEHGKTPKTRLTVSTETCDSEHAPTYLTTVPNAVSPFLSLTSPRSDHEAEQKKPPEQGGAPALNLLTGPGQGIHTVAAA